MNSSFGRLITVLALAAGLALVSIAGASLAFADEASTGQTAQEPLGAISAKAPTGDGDEAGEFGSGGGEPPADVQSEGAAGEPGSGAPLPSTDTAPAAGSGGNSGASLPFTGYVAIPVLLLGVALLGVGVAARRRTASPLSA